MPDYIQDPDDSSKQIPGKKTDQHFDRMNKPITGSYTRQPHYVLVTGTPTQDLGFFFGSSASFATKATTEDTSNNNNLYLSGSQHYVLFGKPAAGTRLDINPSAWSGSLVDAKAGVVTFVYKGGLDGMGRP